MDLNKVDFSAGLGATLGVAMLIFWKRIRQATLDIFGGSLDKTELAGIICMLLLVYMIIKEGDRQHEWQIYNEFYVLIVSTIAMTGFGLKHVLGHIQKMKGISSSETKTEITTTETKQEAKINNNAEEELP